MDFIHIHKDSYYEKTKSMFEDFKREGKRQKRLLTILDAVFSLKQTHPDYYGIYYVKQFNQAYKLYKAWVMCKSIRNLPDDITVLYTDDMFVIARVPGKKRSKTILRQRIRGFNNNFSRIMFEKNLICFQHNKECIVRTTSIYTPEDIVL